MCEMREMIRDAGGSHAAYHGETRSRTTRPGHAPHSVSPVCCSSSPLPPGKSREPEYYKKREIDFMLVYACVRTRVCMCSNSTLCTQRVASNVHRKTVSAYIGQEAGGRVC